MVSKKKQRKLRKSGQETLKKWGTTLHNLGFDVKFYKNGGFKASPVINESMK